jgi:hypothetical protein
MSELNAIDRFLYTSLAADTALAAVVSTRIYADLAPQTPTIVTPYVIFTMLSATDLMVIGGNRVWANSLYLVKGVDKSLTYGGSLKTIADRLDAVVHRFSGVTNADGTVYTAVREQAWRQTETSDGVVYKSAGGIYRIYAK